MRGRLSDFIISGRGRFKKEKRKEKKGGGGVLLPSSRDAGVFALKKNSGQNLQILCETLVFFLRIPVKTKLKSDDWFKSYGPMKYPLGSPLGAAILCISPIMHLMSKSTCGSCLDVCDFQQFLYPI